MKPSHVLTSGLAAVLLAGAASAADIAGVKIPPPFSAGATIDTYWNVKVPDPYRALENVTDPQVQQWMRSHADATTALLAKIPARNALLARIRELEAAAPGAVSSVDRTPAGRIFFLRREPSENQFKLVWRDGVSGADTVIVDPEALAKVAGQPQAVLDYSASPDGRTLAYALQVGGSEIGLLHVVDVASGKPVIEPIDRIRFSSVQWLDDNSGFFYSRLREGFDKLPATERFGDRTRWFRSIKSADHRPVFSPTVNADLKLPIYASGNVFQIPGTQTARLRRHAGSRAVSTRVHRAARRCDCRQSEVAAARRSKGQGRQRFVYARCDVFPHIVRRSALQGACVWHWPNPDLAKAETIIAPGRDVVVVDRPLRRMRCM